MAQSISGTITNLFAACKTVFANTTGTDGDPVLVSLGTPGKYQPNGVVAVAMDVRAPIDRPTMGTNRSREMAAEIDILFSWFVPGDEDSQLLATAGALAAFSQLETYLRTSPNEALGGACRDSWASVANFAQLVAYQPDEDPTQPAHPVGRLAMLTATVTALIRY